MRASSVPSLVVPAAAAAHRNASAAGPEPGPFAGRRRLLDGGPPAHVLAAGRRAFLRLRHYYEPS
jgi:hypothetical protein